MCYLYSFIFDDLFKSYGYRNNFNGYIFKTKTENKHEKINKKLLVRTKHFTLPLLSNIEIKSLNISKGGKYFITFI